MTHDTWSIHYLRTVQMQNVAVDCGKEAVLLLLAVVLRASEKNEVALFWNHELTQFMGGIREETLCKHRDALVDAGWLKYVKGGKAKRGAYIATIPNEIIQTELPVVEACGIS